MSRATKQLTDADRWFALYLRNACTHRWRIKTLALSSPSFNTIEKRLRLADYCVNDEVELIKQDLNHKQLMLKIGMKLGLGARELSL